MRSRLLGAAVLAIAACGARPPAPPGTLTLAVRADITGIYPNAPIVPEGYTIDANRNIFDTLMRFDSQLRLQPGLAARWETPDELTYVFELRSARFSDGTLVTAADVAASLTAVRQHGWVTKDALHAIDSIKVLDEKRLMIRTRHPYLALANRLTWGFVLPADAVDAQPVPTVGSGPYCLVAWRPGVSLTLVRNRRYWGPPPAFETVRYLVVPDDQARIARVETGEADVADHVPLEAIPRLQARSDLQVVARAGLRVLYLALRVDRAPFTDPRVREAVDLAVDRAELVQRIFAGRAQVASQLVPPTVFGFAPEIPLPVPDRKRARQLLDEARVPQGTRLRLDGPINRYANDAAILQEVARQLAEVGLSVEVNGLDKREYYALIDDRSAFYLAGWASESGDAADALDALVHSRTGDGILGTYNALGLADPELDRLIERSDFAQQSEARRRLLQGALVRLSRLRTVLPLVVQTEVVVHSRGIAWDPPVNLALRPAEMQPAASSP